MRFATWPTILRVAGPSAYVKVRLDNEVKDRLVWRWARRHRLVLGLRVRPTWSESLRGAARSSTRGSVSGRSAQVLAASDAGGPLRRLLCVGRLDPRKRIDLLIDAVTILAKRRSDFQVEMVGCDGYIKRWSAFVQRAGARLSITPTKAVSQEILARQHEADALVQPSEHEEFGSAIAEALACGVAVVTGPTKGTGEYTSTASSSRFDRYDPLSVADAIGRALSRNRAARAANRAAAQTFHPSAGRTSWLRS